jgi:hypothetical protein
MYDGRERMSYNLKVKERGGSKRMPLLVFDYKKTSISGNIFLFSHISFIEKWYLCKRNKRPWECK